MSTTAAMSYDFNLDGGGVRLDGDDLVVSGYASNFDVDRVGDTVTRQALDRALSKYMDNPVMLYNHSYTQPAGIVTKALINDRGLWVEARLPRPAIPGMPRHYWDLVRRGMMKALSIGGVWTRDAAKRLVEIDLREISVASVGVNAGTLLSAQTAKAFGDPIDAYDIDRRLAVAELRASRGELQRMRSDVLRLRTDALLNS
jgi:HK97 family phage prohead protease